MIEFYEIAEQVRNDSVKVRNDNIKARNDRNRVRNDILSVMLNLIQHLKNNLLPQIAGDAHVWRIYPSCPQYNQPPRALYPLWQIVETRAA